MASSIIAQTSGGTLDTSATQTATNTPTAAAPLSASHLGHLSHALPQHYAAAAAAHAYLPHQQYQQQQVQQQQYLYHHHYTQQQQQAQAQQHQQQQQLVAEQQQHWDYYARQQELQSSQQQQQQSTNQSPSTRATTQQHLPQQQSATSTTTTSNATSSNNNNRNSNNEQPQQQEQQQQQHSAVSSQSNGNANANSGSGNSSATANTNSNNNYTRPWEMETKDNHTHNHSNTLKSSGIGNGNGNGNGSLTGNGNGNLGGISGFEAFSKLPSFQSQFIGYNDPLMPDGITPMPSAVLPPSMSSLQTVAMSPASLSVSSPGMVSVGSPLAQLNSLQASITPPSSASSFAPPLAVAPPTAPVPPNAFHHLGGHGHHHRSSANYGPLMPTNTASMSGYDDGRHHLPLYQTITPTYATPPPPPPGALGAISSTQQHTLGSVGGGIGALGVSLGIKKEATQTFDLNNGNDGLTMGSTTAINTANTNVTPMGMHTPTTPSYVDGSVGITMMDTSNGATAYHTPHSTHSTSSSGTGTGGPHTPHTTQRHTPTPSTTTRIKVEKVMNSPIARVDARKKERRKNRANSLESSAESEASAMDVDPSNPGQVDAVSSTANFKSPMSALGMGDSNDTNSEKQTSVFQSKKKRKRCGECIGCQRKDNCGECAPCRNDKSHQICKQRRCEKLTEKKIIYGADGQPIRSEKRGRGKARSAAGNGTPTTGVSFTWKP